MYATALTSAILWTAVLQVAPQLAALQNTSIPMPSDDLVPVTLPPMSCAEALTHGASSPRNTASAADVSSGWLSIAAFRPQVLALPTKTRPKRLWLIASDGSQHAFLLKGRDDLRIDERLMQFMRVTNSLLQTSNKRAAVELGSRCYSVTPFGRRAGLVQWVRHTVSLFGLFRSWQMEAMKRHAAVAAARRESSIDAAGAAATGQGVEGSLPLIVAAARPADVFYARLLPALQQAGVAAGAPRKDWPAGG